MAKTLEWEVKPRERKERIRISFKKMRKLWLWFAIFILVLCLEQTLEFILGGWSRSRFLLFCIIIGSLLLFFLLSFLWVYHWPSEKYRLTERGVYKEKAKKRKFYPWDKFIGYYCQPIICPSKVGMVFTFIKKHNPFIPTISPFDLLFNFEIVAEPDNYKDVENFIKKYVKRGVPQTKKDLILFVIYILILGLLITVLLNMVL
jgi:hypothetical protein